QPGPARSAGRRGTSPARLGGEGGARMAAARRFRVPANDRGARPCAACRGRRGRLRAVQSCWRTCATGRRTGRCWSARPTSASRPRSATAPEPREELQARHGAAAARRAARLEERLCGLHFRCSAAELDQRFRPGSFDRVVFNFPLCAARPGGAPAEGDGRGGPRAADAHARGARQAYEDLSVLLEAFFPAAAAVLRTGGECHLRLTDQYLTARGLRAAPACGLALLERLDFFDAFERVYRPLGYRPAVVAPGGGARGRRAGFDVRHSTPWSSAVEA
ncbi:unnamed protein product, partial [Prorocentrum cordatum]